jgi:hypothetical protein
MKVIIKEEFHILIIYSIDKTSMLMSIKTRTIPTNNHWIRNLLISFTQLCLQFTAIQTMNNFRKHFLSNFNSIKINMATYSFQLI